MVGRWEWEGLVDWIGLDYDYLLQGTYSRG
jgi:hypothetical protein